MNLSLLPPVVVEIDCPTCPVRTTATVKTTLTVTIPDDTDGAAVATLEAELTCTRCGKTIPGPAA